MVTLPHFMWLALHVLILQVAQGSYTHESPAGSGGNAAAGGPPAFHSSPAPITQPHRQQMPDNNFHPSLGVIIAILTTMFSLTFLVLLYVKHCKRPPVSAYGSPDLAVLPPAHHHHHPANPDAAPAHHPFTMRRDYAVDDDATGAGLDPLLIHSLPSFPFSSLRGMKDGLECAVCLSRFADPELLRLLPSCHHAFHTHCIDTWLAHHSTCPLCRRQIGLDAVLLGSSFGLRPSSSSDPMSEPSSLHQSFHFPVNSDAITKTGNDSNGAFEVFVERNPDFQADRGGIGICIGSNRLAIGSSNRHTTAGSTSTSRGWSSRWRRDFLVGSGSGRASSRIHNECSSNHGGSFRKSSAAVSQRWMQGAKENDRIEETNAEDSCNRQIDPTVELVDRGIGAECDDNGLSKDDVINSKSFPHELPDHLRHMDEELARRLHHRITLLGVACRRRWSDFSPSHLTSFFARDHGPVPPHIPGYSERIPDSNVANAVAGTEPRDASTTPTRLVAPDIQRRCMSEIPGLHRSSATAKHESVDDQQPVGEARLQDASDRDARRRRWFRATGRALRWLVGWPAAANPSAVEDPWTGEGYPLAIIKS